MLAGAWLAWKRAPLPPRAALLPLAVVSAGCVIGFPWLTSIALRTLPASHGAVLVGILPLATAVFSALRGNEKPSAGFWAMALLRRRRWWSASRCARAAAACTRPTC